jgi:rRNA maturation RNase YbeY
MEYKTHKKISIIRNTKGPIPSVPFFRIVEGVLGKEYKLTLTFATKKHITHLNTTYRNKTYTPNTLAFPLSERAGEIYMSLSTLRAQAHEYDLSYHDFLIFLCIHSCLHLKGFDHGSTMEKLEKKYFLHFAPHATYPYNSRNRN